MARNKKRKVVTHVHMPTPKSPPTMLQYRGYRATLVARNIGTAIRWGGAVAIAWMAYKSVLVLSGQTTIVDVLVNVWGSLKINQALATVLGGGGMLYGWRERRLRHKVNERLGGRVGQLEQAIDKRRTSSRLTKRGQTDPEDAI